MKAALGQTGSGEFRLLPASDTFHLRLLQRRPGSEPSGQSPQLWGKRERRGERRREDQGRHTAFGDVVRGLASGLLGYHTHTS